MHYTTIRLLKKHLIFEKSCLFFIEISNILSGAISPGHAINSIDIGGNFSSIVFGISNTFATIPGLVGPYLVGILTKNVL